MRGIFIKTYKIFLIRHGLTEANLEGWYIGRTDLHLCEEGVRRILALQEQYEYPNVGRVYTSPLLRAVETARLIYPAHTPVTVQDLSECDLGEFENQPLTALQENPAFLSWLENPASPPPGAKETSEDFLKRTVEGIDAVIRDMMKTGVTQAAVITHAGVIQSLLATCGLPKQQASAWMTEDGEGYTLLIHASLWGNTRSFEVFTPLPYGKHPERIMADYQRQMPPDGVLLEEEE